MRFFWVLVTLIAHFSVLCVSQDNGVGMPVNVTCNSNSLYPERCTCAEPEGPCHCVPGWKGIGCTEACDEGHFGLNCSKSCNEHCKNRKCNAANGNCDDGCEEHYIPSKCDTELPAPGISWNDLELQFNYSGRSKQIGKRIILVIQGSTSDQADWGPWNVTLTLDNDEWKYDHAFELKLAPNGTYKIWAMLNKTKSKVQYFNTTWWPPSVPYDLAVIRSNGSVTKLKWKFYERRWEKPKKFLVDIETMAGTRLQNRSTITAWPPEIKGVAGQKEYDTVLNITKPMNCTLKVHVVDENVGPGKPAIARYLFLDKSNWGTAETVANGTVALIRFKASSFPDLLENKDVNVIVDESIACSNVTVNSNEFENLKKEEYPACQLPLDESLVFYVNREIIQTSQLIWLALLPIFALCVLMSFVVYRKYKGTLKLPFFKRTRDIPLPERPKPKELPACDSASTKIQELKRFEDYVRRAAEDGILQQQFKSLPRGLVRSCISGKLPQNITKNRSANLVAYDATRVILARDLDCPSTSPHSTDYINASYVQGYEKQRAYIATQAPLPHTVQDFWTMIWQENVRIICMLVDLKEGGQNVCEKYWPEVEREETYGSVVVTTMNQRVSTDFTFRTFTVQKQGARRSRTVLHLQYTAWPEEGVPMHSHSVVEYIHKLSSLPPGQAPIVVHCGAGTGRTGTIILCDICMRRLSAEGTVDVFSEAKTLFSARANMLSNFAQYVLPHLVPTQCLLSISSKVLCADLTEVKIAEMKKDLPAHIQRLRETSWMDKAMRQLQPIRPQAEENIQKNRFQKLMPVGDSLVSISRYPPYDANSAYISAVSVDGAKIRKQYLASQLPMPSTITDFWRLIVEKNIEVVIILQRPDLNDETCCDIVPLRGKRIPHPHLEVETIDSQSSSEFFTTDQWLLTDKSEEPWRTRTITALICNDWGLDQVTEPPRPEALVDLWMASEEIPRPEGHTLVVCYDGVTGCGLYLALSFMLDRMTVEQECDVILAVRAVRRSRPEFVSAQWQFEYLYDAALKYVENFGEYSNFVRPGGLSTQSEQWP